MLRKSTVTPDGQGTFTITEIEGKTAFVFDSMPAVLLISCDGVGHSTHFFRHGEHVPDFDSFEVKGSVGEVVSYKLDFCAAVRPE